MRTFIAIPLPQQSIEELGCIQKGLRSKMGTGVSWAAPNSIHLTLKFLGEVKEDQIAGIIRELNILCKSLPAFTIKCSGLGCFPNIRQPRVLWVGIEPDKRLSILQTQIESVCTRLGFSKEEKSFSPHLTLGRIRSGLSQIETDYLQTKIKEKALTSSSWIDVYEVILFKSELLRNGAVYSILSNIRLKQVTG